MTITIAIPTFNRAAQLRETLRSIKQLVPPPRTPVDVLIIDNCCTDVTPQVVAEFASSAPFPVRCVREEQQGLCFARNRALQEATSEHIIFLDDDVRIAPHWLAAFLRAVETFNADAVVGPVFPLFESPPPPYYTHAVLDSVTSAYSRKGERPKRLEGEEAHQVPGCNFGVRRLVAIEVGGFDTRLDRIGRGLIGHGDWEFGYALARAHKVIAYEPGCRVEHVISADKLRAASLCARWYGFGAAERALASRHSKNVPRLAPVKSAVRALRYGLHAARARLQGDRGRAFEFVLKACREFGYARGL